MNWSVGVTTVPERFDVLLPGTLASLKEAGFDELRLFIDGQKADFAHRFAAYPCTERYPRVGPFGNWWLSLLELYIREPHADRYALFQDDIQAARGLRMYLEKCEYPAGPDNPGYWNLLTLRSNDKATKAGPGWHVSNQLGRGAAGLVFNNFAVQLILQSPHIVDRVQDPVRGWRAIDGGVVDAMRKAGGKEYVHNPTLVKHVGKESTFSKHKDATLATEKDMLRFVWEEGEGDGVGFKEDAPTI